MTERIEIELDKLASKVGELCGAARHDWSVASYADVGMNGMPIKGWRAAYDEGCRDMAGAVLSALPEEHRQAFMDASRAAFDKGLEDAKADTDGETGDADASGTR